MQRLFIIILISLVFKNYSVNAQAIKEAGVFAGTSYYLGEINPNTQFYDPSPSLGIMFKYLFNSRHGLRFNCFYGQFKASDLDFHNEFQQTRKMSFSATLLDFSGIYEFNFLPYKFKDRNIVFTPFLFGGLGYDFVLKTKYRIGDHFSIPFGFGVKYMATRGLTLGLEWSYRKTFQDKIDGVSDPGTPAENSIISNKDWYSFAGFFITFRLFDKTGNCPVYPQKQ